jgi:hypothetical protein
MKIETINGIRVATPESGMLLCNEEQKVICTKVYLGVNSNEALWKEITETEKAELEAMWNAEATPEIPIDEEATESDYINALEELGVSFDE